MMKRENTGYTADLPTRLIAARERLLELINSCQGKVAGVNDEKGEHGIHS